MTAQDTDYDAYRARWKPRLGLKDEHLALGYMRGLGADDRPLPDDPDATGIHVRVDGRGMDALVDPARLDHYVTMWEVEIEGRPNPRQFTKDFIAQTLALNMDLDERGPVVVGAVLWLAAESETAFAALKQERGAALVCDFAYDNQARTRRLQIRVVGR